MPDDLLRFVGGPPGPPLWWLWTGLALLAAAVAWTALVLVATGPPERLRQTPGLRSAHAQLLRRRYARDVAGHTRRYRAGELSAEQAGAAISRTLRSFLQQATGLPAPYLQLRELAAGRLASAAPVLEQLGEAQFGVEADVDVASLGDRTEELIRTWA